MSWADLFERAERYETTVETVREALRDRRAERDGEDESDA